MTLVAKMKAARTLAALLFCALATFANAQTYTGLTWGIDRTATPNEIAVKSADGSQWFKLFKLTAAGVPAPYFASTFCGDNEWITANSGVPSCAQPAFSDISGILQASQEPAHTGDVTNPAGSLSLTIANNAVTNAKAAQMAGNTLKGNNTGGTANPADLTATQATAMLNAMVGDSGSGGLKGLVPAPAAGDAAAGKFLKADGTWAAPSGGGGSSTLIANSFPNVDPTGVADSAAGLNAVINSCPAGGCTIELCGDYSVSASLVIGDGTNSAPSTKQGVRLVGCGKPNIAQYDGWAGYSSAIATRIKWTGGSGAVINLAGPLRGWGLENLFIDCNNTASTTGIQNISASVGSAENISIRLCTRGILSTTRTFTGAGFHGSASAFNNTYKHFSIYVRNEASAMGMFLDGVYQAAGSIGATTCPCLASTTVSSFEDFYILMGSSTNAQYGVYLRVADTNTFKNIGVLLNPTPGSRGILWDYASNSTLPANNAFHEGYVSSVLGTGTTNTHVNSGTAPAGATTHNWVDRPALINGDTWSTITNTIVTSP